MGLLTSFNKTNLDVENSGPSGFFNKDTTTNFSALTTGTPTDTANPGPTKRFIQRYLPSFLTYLNDVPVGGEGKLLYTLSSTNLDVEDERPNGGIPYKQDKDPTQYPWFSTGTPNFFSAFSAASKFNQQYNPQNLYAYRYHNILEDSLFSTSLDIERESPDGGIPYKQDKDPTQYPWYVTGAPTADFSPGPANKFFQTYDPYNDYLDNIPEDGFLKKSYTNSEYDLRYGFRDTTTHYPVTSTKGIFYGASGFLQEYNGEKQYIESHPPGWLDRASDLIFHTYGESRLDLTNPRPGPVPDPTVYPKYVTGTPSTKKLWGNVYAPAFNFTRPYDPDHVYLDKVPIRGDGRLRSTTANTSLDVTDPRPNGGVPYKEDKDPTIYPIYSTGIPSRKSIFTAAEKFEPWYDPGYVYLEDIKDYSYLERSTGQTNLDVSDKTPDGGIPYKIDKDPTSYPKYTTGVPTTEASPGPFNKFNQIYTPKNVYLDKFPIRGEGKLRSTTANSNLDVEDETPDGGIPYKVYNDPTTYPETTTGTPEFAVNPAAPSRFEPQFSPAQTYLDYVRSIYDRSRSHLLHLGKEGDAHYSIFTATNLDIEDEFPNGGIPYIPDLTDFTVYPIVAKKKSPVKGFNSVEGLGATKYAQLWTPNNTYSAFMDR